MKPKLSAALVLAPILVLATETAMAQDARSTTDGVFTAAQAKSGEEADQSHCSGCHGLDLRKTDAEAPDLTEGPFRFGWHGKTIGERFEKTRSTMPKAAVRSLPDQVYLDIVVYILAFNGVPTGTDKLLPNIAALDKITIDVPASSGGGGRRR